MNEATMLEKIYKKFESIKKEANIDCSFDKKDIESGFNVTNSLSKWITNKTEWSRVYRDLEIKRKNAWRTQFEFYQTDYPLKLSSKDEYTLFIESDVNYVEHMNISNTVKEVIHYIDAIIDTLKSKQWEVKNYIEYQKFINGQ